MCTVCLSQGLLMHVSRSTKGTLSRLGVFTVSSFHAYICARSPSLLNNLLAGRGATKRRYNAVSHSRVLTTYYSIATAPPITATVIFCLLVYASGPVRMPSIISLLSTKVNVHLLIVAYSNILNPDKL